MTDLIDAHVKALEHAKPSKVGIYNVGTGKGYFLLLINYFLNILFVANLYIHIGRSGCSVKAMCLSKPITFDREYVCVYIYIKNLFKSQYILDMNPQF